MTLRSQCELNLNRSLLSLHQLGNYKLTTQRLRIIIAANNYVLILITEGGEVKVHINIITDPPSIVSNHAAIVIAEKPTRGLEKEFVSPKQQNIFCVNCLEMVFYSNWLLIYFLSAYLPQ